MSQTIQRHEDTIGGEEKAFPIESSASGLPKELLPTPGPFPRELAASVVQEELKRVLKTINPREIFESKVKTLIIEHEAGLSAIHAAARSGMEKEAALISQTLVRSVQTEADASIAAKLQTLQTERKASLDMLQDQERATLQRFDAAMQQVRKDRAEAEEYYNKFAGLVRPLQQESAQVAKTVESVSSLASSANEAATKCQEILKQVSDSVNAVSAGGDDGSSRTVVAETDVNKLQDLLSEQTAELGSMRNRLRDLSEKFEEQQQRLHRLELPPPQVAARVDSGPRTNAQDSIVVLILAFIALILLAQFLFQLPNETRGGFI